MRNKFSHKIKGKALSVWRYKINISLVLLV